MNHALAEALQPLNLQPGTYRCELAENEVVVEVRPRVACDIKSSAERKSALLSADPVTIDESCIMLDPWVEFPEPSGGIILESHLGTPDLPDVPEIPPYDEDEEEML
jgi:hypothetical protein